VEEGAGLLSRSAQFHHLRKKLGRLSYTHENLFGRASPPRWKFVSWWTVPRCLDGVKGASSGWVGGDKI
jgi:hypothetical protein